MSPIDSLNVRNDFLRKKIWTDKAVTHIDTVNNTNIVDVAKLPCIPQWYSEILKNLKIQTDCIPPYAFIRNLSIPSPFLKL